MKISHLMEVTMSNSFTQQCREKKTSCSTEIQEVKEEGSKDLTLALSQETMLIKTNSVLAVIHLTTG